MLNILPQTSAGGSGKKGGGTPILKIGFPGSRKYSTLVIDSVNH